MGQYYKAIILNYKTKKPQIVFDPHKWANGVKLMEHSWLRNNMIQYVECLLEEKPRYLVWAGDYADAEEGLDKNLYDLSDRQTLSLSPEDFKYKWIDLRKDNKYLINHTKKQFINKKEVSRNPHNKYWKIHPLSILTAEGNGRGGGDYCGHNEDKVGIWSRDLIGVARRKTEIPNGYTELIVNFYEEL
jgi:hypothetical protein